MYVMPSWFEEEIEPQAGPDAKDLAHAARAALVGGESIERFDERDPDVRSGQWGGPVTEADRASHHAILDVLGRLSPADGIRSEEGREEEVMQGGAAAPAERLWLVDPLDGTREFLARNGEFSVMVGLARKGRAVLGAVYQPLPDRLFLGVARAGSWVVEDPRGEARVQALRVGAETEVDRRPLRVVRSRSHPHQRLERLADLPRGIEWVVSGSVGVKCAMIAEGRADLYVHPVPYLKEWDTCAPEAVLVGAGGRVTDCLGATLDYGKKDPHQPGGIFASPPEVWKEVAPLVSRLFQSDGASPDHGASGELPR